MDTLKKPDYRALMPVNTSFVDVFRDVFGKDEINPQISAAMKGAPTFYAKENGFELGTKSEPGFCLSLNQIEIGSAESGSTRKRA